MEKEILFHSGRIWTSDGIKSWMIIKDNIIFELGEGEFNKRFNGTKINLNGKLVLPGLHDAHIHNYSLGRLEWRVNLSGVKSIIEIQNKLKNYNLKSDMNWIIGHGWDQDRFKENRYLTKDDIDEVINDRPVILYRACNHIATINSKAIEILKLEDMKKEPEGGEIDRNMNNEIIGILREEALSLVTKHVEKQDMKMREKYFKKGIERCVNSGLTAIHTNDASAWKYYSELAKNGELPLRVYLTMKYSDLDKEDYLPKYNEQIGLLKCKRVKLFADGSLGAETAKLRENYDDLEHSGIMIENAEALEMKIRRIHELGYQLEIHAIGDKAIELVIESFEKVGLKKEDRAMITHCQVMANDLISKMSQYGYIANIQPPFVPTDSMWVEKRLGLGERYRYSYAWKTLIDNGIIVTGGSDAPIENPSPFWGIYCAIMRPDFEGNIWRENECLDFETALEIYTANSAYALREENNLGILEKGYLADFIICDPMIMYNAERLNESPLYEVWVDGKRRV